MLFPKSANGKNIICMFWIFIIHCFNFYSYFYD